MSANEFPKEVLEALKRDLGIEIKKSAKRNADGRLCYGDNASMRTRRNKWPPR